MESKKLLQSDYLDIIFDKRNKNYGGYELRRNYNRRMKKAGLFVMLSISAMISFSFISSREHEKAKVMTYTTGCKISPVDLTPKPPIEPTKPPATPPPPAPAKTDVFTIPKITKDPIKPEELMSEVKKLENSTSGLAHVDSGTVGISTAKIPGTGSSTVVTTVTPPVDKPWIVVDQMPEYAGNLNAYLASNIQYPEAARNAGIEGRVGVQFVVNEDGSISNVKVMRGIGAGCDEEAMRVLRSMPKWKPGKNNGVAVKVLFNQPITFKLTQ